jgi:outer membrane immunogenic protein
MSSLRGSLAAIVIAGASCVAAAAPAVAHDHQRWGGLYIGAHIGGSWADYRVTGDNGAFDEAGVERYTQSLESIIGGAQIGLNHQFGRIVVGIEADVSFADAQDTILQLADPDNIVRSKLGTHGTLTARLGYDAGQWMPYVKGGLAWAQLDVLAADIVDGTVNIDASDLTQSSGIRGGWTIGAGVDYALTKNWIARAEYAYMDFRSFNTRNLDGDTFRHDLELHSVRVGVSYKWAREEHHEPMK